jgi:hypothetical protein
MEKELDALTTRVGRVHNALVTVLVLRSGLTRRRLAAWAVELRRIADALDQLSS